MTARLSAVVAWLLTVAAVAAGQTPGADPVVATIGGIPVRLSDLDARSREVDAGSYARIQMEQYDLRRRTLDSIIAAYLVETEAKRRGMSVDKLLEHHESGEVHGIGETSVPPVMPAIGNAVYRATGVRIKDLPITPEKVLRGLREKGIRGGQIA